MEKSSSNAEAEVCFLAPLASFWRLSLILTVLFYLCPIKMRQHFESQLAAVGEADDAANAQMDVDGQA